MYLVELAKTLRRGRTWLLAGTVASLPLIIVIALRSNPARASAPSSTPFLFPIVKNGYYAALSGLAVAEPYLLPLAIGLLAGDAIAGEAQAGTLVSLLVRPVPRVRLVLAKYFAAMTLVAALIASTVVVGVIAGGVAFGLGPLPSLSGTTFSVGGTIARLIATGSFMIAVSSGVASMGIWVSTMTNNGPAAAVITAAIAVVSQILDKVPSLIKIGPYLPTHGWLGYVGFFRFPAYLLEMRRGLAISGAYTVVFLTLAVLGFAERDIA